MGIKVQFGAAITNLHGEEIREPVKNGFVDEVHQALRQKLESIGTPDDLLKGFDALIVKTKVSTIGDVVCAALMHGDLRDPKKLVERLDEVRRIQAAEKSLTPLEYDEDTLADMRKIVAEGPSPSLFKAQACLALKGNVPEA